MYCERASQLSPVQLFATPWTMVHGILQPRILEWVAFPYSRGSSQSGIKPRSPTMQVTSLPAEPQGKPQMYGGYLRYFCPPQIPAFNPIEKTSLYLLKTQCNTLAT